MKNKSLVTAGLLAVGLASSASAVDVYITGSTAFRANVNNALNTAIFDGGSPTTVNPSFASGASQQTFTGTIGGTAFNVFVDFTGSEAGIASLTGLTIANNVQDDNGINHNGNLPGTPSPTFRNTSGAGTFTHAPDISMADTTSAVSLSKNTAITRVGG